MTLGQRIAFHRKQKALTQQQLGEQLNVSAQAISKWENDQAEPDVATLIRLSEIFEVPIGEVMKGENDTPADATAANEPPKAEPAPQKPQGNKKPLSRSHKKAILTTVIIAFWVAALVAVVLLILKFTVWAPISSADIELVEYGMTMEEVEELLGTPHKQKVTKELDGYTYEVSDDMDSTFSESFLEGLTGKKATVVSATYYYYDGEYGRKLEEINKLEEKIANLDLDAPISQLKKLEEKLSKLEEELKEMEDQEPLAKIIFDKNGVVKVNIN